MPPASSNTTATSVAATPATSAPLDFEALLSRQYRPARVSRLVPREAVRVKKKRHVDADNSVNEEVVTTNHAAQEAQIKKKSDEDEILKLALQLVSQTPAYRRHVKNAKQASLAMKHLNDSIPEAPKDEWKTLPPSLHEVELGDWEKDIRWEGHVPEQTSGDGATKHQKKQGESSALALMMERRNPHLDAWDASDVCWDAADALKKAKNVPLILDVGVTGQSVAQQFLPSSRPLPFGQSEEYIQRREREWSTPAISTANVSGGLHADREQQEKEFEERQKKRAQMAKDKSTRVTEAMGTLSMGGGKGRTITSSLMGPGGTERTGRPSRHAGSSATHTEYIEQPELVANHMLVKPDLRMSELRQYHRPKIPRSAARIDRPWQFQIRLPSSKKKDPDPNASSYQSMMLGSHGNPMSQVQIRSEPDLSPTEGQLVLLEYSEERPPIQLTKGMASKIVNFYRGDKTKCPVSAGGGDRPTRRKLHHGDNKTNGNKGAKELEKPPRLLGPNHERNTTLADWIGKPPKKKEAHTEKSSVNILPEGVTEILHPKVHGPFIGEVEDGVTQTGLISNLFTAPMFQHEPESTDFLMILGHKSSSSSRLGIGNKSSMGVVLRTLPTSVFCVGQTEPRTKVFAPNTTGERSFIVPFICYQIAKVLTLTEEKEGRGLRFDAINDGLFANTALPPNALRQRIKQVAVSDKNSHVWTAKPIGMDDYPGVEALGRRFTPEGVAAYETECAASRRLCDLGIQELYSGSSSVASVGLAMVYLAGQVNAARERKSKLNKMLEFARTTKTNTKTFVTLYEAAASILEGAWKEMKRKHEVARFIYEELQLAPWHLTTEFIDVHKNAQGTAMMRLTGLGDPSGLGEGYNFLREVDTKPNKGSGNTDGALSAQIKKITGTENDLRRLTMKQMASLLRSYGMTQEKIDMLKRWDRVHVIRDLSTKAASDGLGDGLERFARGEKMKLSEQKQMYQARIQEIWRRQRVALSADAGDIRGVTPGVGLAGVGGSSLALDDAAGIAGTTNVGGAAAALEESKQVDKDMEDSDSDFDDDDLAAEIEENMMNVQQTNQLVAAHVRGEAGDSGEMVGGLVAQQRGVDTQELSKDARELAALKRQQEEARKARAGFSGDGQPLTNMHVSSMLGRKVVRKRITKTHPDGRQTTVFKFVCLENEVAKVIAKKKSEEVEAGYGGGKSRKKGSRHGSHHHRSDTSQVVGHSMFEDDDEYDRGRTSLKFQVKKRSVKSKGGHLARAPPKSHRPRTMLGKLKHRESQERRMKKRKREAEEADLYTTASKRMGTSNRRERGAARDRMPHVILADRLEQIRAAAEQLTGSAPFHRQVSRRDLPQYYEVISDPVALETIRDKNNRYEYKTADSFLRDFELMRNNCAKFNGKDSILTRTADALYGLAKDQVEQNRSELNSMEDAVQDQLDNGKKKKRAKSASSSKPSGSSAAKSETNTTVVDGVTVDLGDIDDFAGVDSDSDDSADMTSFFNSNI